MYPLGPSRSGPTVRINHMRDALREIVNLDIVAGSRGRRALALGRYLAAGRMRGLAGIYVESSTALPGPADIAFLAAAGRRGVPVLTYVRDAYQLFPEYWSKTTLKARLGRRLFLPAFRRLAAASTLLAFPSQGLADVLGAGREAILLPPGAPPPVEVERRSGANRLLVVGNLRDAVLGAEILMAAIEQIRAEGLQVELDCVTRPGDEPPGPLPSWVHIRRANASDIHALLPDVFASVIPRRRSHYNDFAVPVKLMEYLSYGRPLLATDCTETARIVRSTGSGLVVADTAAALADGVRTLFTAAPAELDRLSEAARSAAAANSWRVRAERVVEALRVRT